MILITGIFLLIFNFSIFHFFSIFLIFDFYWCPGMPGSSEGGLWTSGIVVGVDLPVVFMP